MSVLVQWDPSFSVGNEVMDRQHKQLLNLCNELASCVDAPPNVARSRFHDILNDLTQYARQHFETEESLLAKFKYPALSAQQTEHTAYEEKIISWAFDATVGTLDLNEAQQFLASWWKEHILVSDMQYKALLLSKRG